MVVWFSKRTRLYIAVVLSILPLAIHAERLDIHAEADRPGMGTGTNVLPFGSLYSRAGERPLAQRIERWLLPIRLRFTSWRTQLIQPNINDD